MNSDYSQPTEWSTRKAALLHPSMAIVRVELQTGKKQQMDSHYVNVPVPYVVEENYFPDHNDLTLAQILQDQETAYQSLHKDAPFDAVKALSTPTSGDRDGRLQRHKNSFRAVNVDSQLAMDEAYARELQELENQLSYTSLNRTSGTGTDVTRTQSSTSSSEGTYANSATTQVDGHDDVDPDNMTYEELQSLGEAIGTESRGLSDELISYLPTSAYKTGLFSRREKNEEGFSFWVVDNDERSGGDSWKSEAFSRGNQQLSRGMVIGEVSIASEVINAQFWRGNERERNERILSEIK